MMNNTTLEIYKSLIQNTLENIFASTFKFRMFAFLILCAIAVYAAQNLDFGSDNVVFQNQITINISHEAAHNEYIKTQILPEIEREIQKLENQRDFTSYTDSNTTKVEIQLASNSDTADTILELKNNLPIESYSQYTQNFQITDTSHYSRPAVSIILSTAQDQRTLNQLASNFEHEIVQLSTVDKIEVFGKANEEIFVELKVESLDTFGISPVEIVDIIKESNFSTQSGSIDIDDQKYALKINATQTNIDDIRNQLIPVADQFVALKDIANVRYIQKPDSTSMRIHTSADQNNPAIRIDLYATKNSNSNNFQSQISKTISEFSTKNPQITVQKTQDLTTQTQTRIIYTLAGVLAVILFLYFVMYLYGEYIFVTNSLITFGIVAVLATIVIYWLQIQVTSSMSVGLTMLWFLSILHYRPSPKFLIVQIVGFLIVLLLTIQLQDLTYLNMLVNFCIAICVASGAHILRNTIYADLTAERISQLKMSSQMQFTVVFLIGTTLCILSLNPLVFDYIDSFKQSHNWSQIALINDTQSNNLQLKIYPVNPNQEIKEIGPEDIAQILARIVVLLSFVLATIQLSRHTAQHNSLNSACNSLKTKISHSKSQTMNFIKALIRFERKGIDYLQVHTSVSYTLFAFCIFAFLIATSVFALSSAQFSDNYIQSQEILVLNTKHQNITRANTSAEFVKNLLLANPEVETVYEYSNIFSTKYQDISIDSSSLSFHIQLKPKYKYQSSIEIENQLKTKIAEIQGLDFDLYTVHTNHNPETTQDLIVSIPEDLAIKYNDPIVQTLNTNNNLINTNIQDAKQTQQISINLINSELTRRQIKPAEISNWVTTLMVGKNLGIIQTENGPRSVKVGTQTQELTVDQIKNLSVKISETESYTLADIASITLNFAPDTNTRQNAQNISQYGTDTATWANDASTKTEVEQSIRSKLPSDLHPKDIQLNGHIAQYQNSLTSLAAQVTFVVVFASIFLAFFKSLRLTLASISSILFLVSFWYLVYLVLGMQIMLPSLFGLICVLIFVGFDFLGDQERYQSIVAYILSLPILCIISISVGIDFRMVVSVIICFVLAAVVVPTISSITNRLYLRYLSTN